MRPVMVAPNRVYPSLALIAELTTSLAAFAAVGSRWTAAEGMGVWLERKISRQPSAPTPPFRG